ncbi:helix-turn-helix transcriptional regulator [Gloeothece verrucosa]|uniref:Transcriptional regulator, XRE family n=1 Tax=Gloeothece verrucosa (strain PCC 7822) TaxID=497965 RepID=E0ULZ0_GLOV7|nr:helix-turn-helix transcriptional regulator [Gloeothece verrucosa]ADN17970.1 transcriptional regulator, XRE family [Gloeothece verrucosa PCC 7822]
MNDEFAKKMLKLREKAGLTQRQVANELGVTDQTVSNWETGQRKPRLSSTQWLKLCQLFQCSLEDLAE